MTDEQLEKQISDTCSYLLMANSDDDFKMLSDKLKELINQRSPTQIAKMERERGLV